MSAPLPAAAGNGMLASRIVVPVVCFAREPPRITGKVRNVGQEPEPAEIEPAELDHLSVALDRAGIGLLTVDAADRILTANPSAERRFGLASGALARRPLRELIGARPDGDAIPVELSAIHAGPDRSGPITIILRDLAKELCSTKERWLRAEQRARLGSYASVLEEPCSTRWSAGLYQITGLSPDARPPGPAALIEQFVHPGDHELARTAFLALVEQGRPFDLPFRLVRQDGEVRHVQHAAWPILDREGRVVAIDGLVQDVTDRIQLELDFLQSQKLEAAGKLAGGIAHDFNNILMAISSSVRIAERRPDDPARLRAGLLEVGAHLQRASQLTRKLLDLNRRGHFEPVPLDLRDVVASCKTICERLLGEEVELCVTGRRRPAPVLADPEQIEQALLNLLANARDALPVGGRVEIDVSELNHDVDTAGAEWHAEAGRYCVLSVSDTGCGMDARTRAHMFEPYFTTKNVGNAGNDGSTGRGTGLGLAMVHSMIRQVGGHVLVESEPRRGTTVRLCFPRLMDPALVAPRRERVHAPPRRPGQGETILLAEDDPAVRGGLRGLLVDLGYQVLSAADPEQALCLFQERRGEIDLLLTDIVMPGMGGRELAERIAARSRNTSVVFMSAFSRETLVKTGRIPPGVRTLSKPFTERELARTLKAALERSGRESSSA